MGITRLVNKLRNYHINCHFKVDILIKKGFRPPSIHFAKNLFCLLLLAARFHLVLLFAHSEVARRSFKKQTQGLSAAEYSCPIYGPPTTLIRDEDAGTIKKFV